MPSDSKISQEHNRRVEACEVARKALDMDSSREIAVLLNASSSAEDIRSCAGKSLP
jgi:hypothetical protein